MELNITKDLFSLKSGDTVSKRNLFDLIQRSKVTDSEFWSGELNIIRNTPQQGINWVGELPDVKGVIIKTRPNSYEEDGWVSKERDLYQYSFKARNGVISYSEKANQVLICQPQYLYPILLLTEEGNLWRYEGSFSVTAIENTYVVLGDYTAELHKTNANDYGDDQNYEGSRKYVSHLMAERNKKIVKEIKESREWVCEMCHKNFQDIYGVSYIEAHHKVPISNYSSRHKIRMEDFSLLCPNCHKAVHVYMNNEGLEYSQIIERLTFKGS